MIELKCQCGRWLEIGDPEEGKGIQCKKCNRKYVLTDFDGEWDLLLWEYEDWPGKPSERAKRALALLKEMGDTNGPQ